MATYIAKEKVILKIVGIGRETKPDFFQIEEQTVTLSPGEEVDYFEIIEETKTQ